MKVALIAGATGLIGQQVLSLLLNDPQYSQVIALTRKPLEAHPKLKQVETDFSNLEQKKSDLQADTVFCCLGTTMAKAGSKENFYRVDFHFPYLLARISYTLGARQFLMVSALGANPKSSVFYNRVKGEAEKAISEIGFSSVHFFRPSLLLGARDEKRSGEKIAKSLFTFFDILIPAKYKAIDSAKVARAMVRASHDHSPGIQIHESRALQRHDRRHSTCKACIGGHR